MTIVGLVFMLAVLIYMLETNQPAKMFPLMIPSDIIWRAAYGQQQEGAGVGEEGRRKRRKKKEVKLTNWQHYRKRISV